MRRRTSIPLSLIGGGAVAGAAALGWAAGVEVRSFRLRRVEAPVLAPGSRPLRVLHLSDLHMTPGQQRKRDWVRALAGLEPDLVVDTGDNLAHREAVPAVLDALGPLLERPGVFVMGSNDYFAPTFKNPARYLLPGREIRLGKRRLPTESLREGLVGAGWVDLDNARERVKVDHREIELVGTDDPHIRADRYDEVAGPADPSADLSLGVTHAPVPPRPGPDDGGRLRADPRRPHPRRAAVRARRRRAGHQLRPASAPGEGAVDPRARREARPGCTSPRGSAPRRTPRSASPARPRPRC